MVEHLPGQHKALSSNLMPLKKKKKNWNSVTEINAKIPTNY
jgi:hypothetical protein